VFSIDNCFVYTQIEVTHTVDSCTQRSQRDDTIKWWYRGTLEDGTEFHTGHYEATLGHNQVQSIDFLEKNLILRETLQKLTTFYPHKACSRIFSLWGTFFVKNNV